MRFVIVTGMSGAGKSTALKMLEDMGYFCVDNLPIQLMPKFAEMLMLPDAEISQAALGVDIRNGQALDGIEEQLSHMDDQGIQYEILFLDARDNVLVKRYKETRRQHPLGGIGRVDIGIAKERERIAFLKMRATYILDTSKMLTRELKQELEKIFQEELRRLYCLDKSTIARRAAKLEEAGYIYRRPSAADKRRKELFVTEKGDALREAKVEAEAFYFRWLTAELTEAELSVLVPLLDQLQRRSRDERRQEFVHLLEEYERMFAVKGECGILPDAT